jgi:conjugative relaxase-like TrwC/TraI family protein
MINFSKVTQASDYNTRHLSHNDYYEEGCRVEGYWFGRGAESLGLSGAKDQDHWKLICANKHPFTGEKLTARSPKIQAFDFIVSAPKAVSILAMTGGDSRLVEDHQAASQLAIKELERFAVRRLREGVHFDSEDVVRCGNITALRYDHTAARGVGGQIDPQVHTHFLIANRVQDPASKKWYALSEREMAFAVGYAKEVYRNELARRLKGHGYGIENRKEGFGISGIHETLEQKFSQRSVQRDEAIARFKAENKRDPTKREIARLVRETREKKLPHVSSQEVLAQQRKRLTPGEWRQIKDAKHGLSSGPPAQRISEAPALSFALDDSLERASTVKETDLLKNALEHARGDLELSLLKAEMERRVSARELYRFGDRITTRDMLMAEERICSWVRDGKGTQEVFGRPLSLPAHFTEEQRSVVHELLASKDRVVALIGDAGTSKTTCAEYIAKGIQLAGREVTGLAPTGTAAAELRGVVADCDTLQGFLASPQKQEAARGKVLLLDEAGMVDVRSMDKLGEVSQRLGCRVVLMGDPKQNQSVGAGDAFRCLLADKIEVHQLTEIWRQTDPAFKKAVELMAQGKGGQAFDSFHKLGTVSSIPEESKLFQAAAQEYVRAVQAHKTVMAVSPVWKEIHAFTAELRPQLKQAGLLGEEQRISVIEPDKTFTQARKQDFRRYEKGMVLKFYRKGEHAKAGDEVRVVERKRYGIVVEKTNGQRFSLATGDADKFSVFREKVIGVAPGEKLLLRGKCPAARLSTGDVVEVEKINPDRSLQLKTGQTLPADFRLFDHGYCLTSHGSQGKKAQVSVSVMGEAGLRSAKAREAYVAHSRFREKIAVFTTNPEKAREVFQKAGQRLLAKEVRQQSESKALATARAEARQFLTQNQKEQSHDFKNETRMGTTTRGEPLRTSPTYNETNQSGEGVGQPEAVAAGGELRHRAGSDRQDEGAAGEQARIALVRRNNSHRQRARRSVGPKLGQGYRH